MESDADGVSDQLVVNNPKFRPQNLLGSAAGLLTTSSVLRGLEVDHSWCQSVSLLLLLSLLWTRPAGPEPPEPAQSGLAVAAVNSDLCRITPSGCSAGRVFSMKRGSAFS